MISPRVVPDDGIPVLSLVGLGVPGSNFDSQLQVNAMCLRHVFSPQESISRGRTGYVCEPKTFLLICCSGDAFN